MFAFAQLPLHNINETAPETWDGGLYNEKSDVFSFGMMLWRLFGSARQNRKTSILDPLPAPRPPLYRQDPFAAIPPMNDEEEVEFDHLKVNGRSVHPVNQRAIIRKVLSRSCYSIFFSPCPLLFSNVVNRVVDQLFIETAHQT